MKTAILYGSTHGKTRRVVTEVMQHLTTSAVAFDVRQFCRANDEKRTIPNLSDFDLLLFFCPTYGDEELQDDLEKFLQTFVLEAGKFFVVCELGSYYGYEDFSFGAMRIIRRRLLECGGLELCEPLSLDSFPRLNTRHLLDWVDYLNGKINEHIRFCNA